MNKMCLFREICLFLENVLILGSGGFRILGIVFFVKLEKNFPDIQI